MMKNNVERLRLVGFCKTTIDYILSLSPNSDDMKKIISEIDWNKIKLVEARMMANDMIEWGSTLSKDQISVLDSILQTSGSPTFTVMKYRNYRKFLKILSRGFIKSESEFYLIQNFLSDADSKDFSEEELTQAEKLSRAYETSIS
jgi:hypothetical protein